MRRTQAERNEETRRALLKAGASLLREVGYARTTVGEISRRAERAHGTFYLHFENKGALVAVLLDGMAVEAQQQARNLWRTEPHVDAIWLGLREFLSHVIPERSLWSVVEEMAALGEDVTSLRYRIRNFYVDPILQGLKERPEELLGRTANLEVLADVLASTGLHFARYGRLPAPPDVLALNMTAVWCYAIGRPMTEAEIEHLRTWGATGR